ncbi:MAG: PAS domain S-box protein [Rhodospirillaceae bacterium]
MEESHAENAEHTAGAFPRDPVRSLDAAAIGVSHIDSDGIITYVNARWSELLGYERSEIVGRTSAQFTYPEDIDVASEVRRALLRGDIATKIDEKRFLRKDGRVIWVKRWLSVVRSASGAPDYIVAVYDDITDTKLTAERYRAIFDNAAVGITQVRLDGVLVDVNDKFCKMLGYTRQELDGKSIRDITPAEDYGTGASFRQRILKGEVAAIAGEKRLIRKDGSVMWVRRTMSVVRDNVGAPVFVISVVEDVSERKRAEEALTLSEQILRATFSQAGVGILFSTPDLRILQVNDKYCELLGYTREELLGMTIADINTAEDIELVIANRDRLMRGEINHAIRERQLLRKDGTLTWVEHFTSLVRDLHGNPQHFVTVAQDIRERKAAEGELKRLAHYDALTGLPNRMLFYRRLEAELAHALANESTTAVLFVDIDRFKYVNDTMGHAAGDKLLKLVGNRLSQAVRRHDTVGRLGGDEFAVVAAGLKQASDARRVAQKIIAAFNDPIEVDGMQLYVTASVGITLCPADSTDPDVLIRNADAAMYRAKDLGRNTYEFYAPDINVHAHAMITLGNELRQALERGEFLLHYQPKVRLATGELTGFEALLRWQRGDGTLLMPGEFVQVLEETGLIVPVGKWVIEAACRQLVAWQAANVNAVPIAVNLSPRQFRAAQLVATVREILDRHGVPPHLLQLEITESLLADRSEAVQSVQALTEAGISIAIDDFGTGYSNLASLKRFAVDTVKIDHSFVRDIDTDDDDAAIVRAIVNMAHSLNLAVVAEGVENDAQLEFLRQCRCDEMQGYYVAHPAPAEEHLPLLRAGLHARTRPVCAHGVG